MLQSVFLIRNLVNGVSAKSIFVIPVEATVNIELDIAWRHLSKCNNRRDQSFGTKIKWKLQAKRMLQKKYLVES